MKKYHVTVYVETDIEAKSEADAEAQGLEWAESALETCVDLAAWNPGSTIPEDAFLPPGAFAECFYARAVELNDEDE